MIDDDLASTGKLSENTSALHEMYSRNVSEKESGRKYIPTGIPLIDAHTGGGLRRREFNAVLGYTGQRKTAILRTMGYHAAAAGFRVLHITLESDYNEELAAYLVMHSHSRDWGTEAANVRRKEFEEGTLTEEQRAHLLGPVLLDFNGTIGKTVTVYEPKGNRTWADVKAFIERECMLETVDLVLIDYLTMLEPDPEVRDRNTAMTQMIQDAKRLCMKANRGEGLCMVTPVQGNRKGLEDAEDNDGAWEVTGISMYSEMDKSLDNCYYVYMTPDMASVDELKFGSCEMRRHQNIPSSFLSVNQRAGMIEAPKASMVQASGSAGPSKRTAKNYTPKKPAAKAPIVTASHVDDLGDLWPA